MHHGHRGHEQQVARRARARRASRQPALHRVPGRGTHHLLLGTLAAQVGDHQADRSRLVREGEARLPVQQRQGQLVARQDARPGDGRVQRIVVPHPHVGARRQRRQQLDGVLHLEHPERAAGMVEQALEQGAALHLRTVGAPAVEDIVVVPHHHRGHARHGLGGVQRRRPATPGRAVLAQPAVGVQAQVVVLDLALQRGVHRIAQLFVTRQPDPALERLDVFPDRIEIDLVAAHQHQVKALAALVVDLRLVPQLLAIERIIGRPQLPVVVAQQVGPHGVLGLDELAHAARIGKPVTGHVGHARRRALGRHGELPGLVHAVDGVGHPPFILARLARQVVAQVDAPLMTQQRHRRGRPLALQRQRGRAGALIHADQRRYLPRSVRARAAKRQHRSQQQFRHVALPCGHRAGGPRRPAPPGLRAA